MNPSTPASPSDPDRLLALGQERGPVPGAAPVIDREQLARLLPEFEFHELLGRGGMGVVYRARHKRLDRIVAVKVLPPELAQRDPAFAERFQREARVLARLTHPNIVRIFDFGEAQGLSYLVLEYIEGTSLRQLMAMGRLSPAEALRLVPQVCAALQYAHDHGVVHRDIKPENLLIDQHGEVHIADFGIARIVGDPGQAFTLTTTRQRLGTPHYMAPEQVETPERVDHRADIFALGVVVYEMLTGSLPLGRFAPPSAGSAVGPRVDEIVLRSLEREPAQRYQAAQAMQADLEAAWREGFAAGARQPVGAGVASGGNVVPPASPGHGAPGVAAAPPIQPRLSWLAMGGLLWFVTSPVALLLFFLPVQMEAVTMEPTPPPAPALQLTLRAVFFLCLAGSFMGSVLGTMGLRRIQRSQGRLYGIRPAVLAIWLPGLLLADLLVAGVVRGMAKDTPDWVAAVLVLVVLWLNYRFLVRQVEAARQGMVRAGAA